MKADNFSSSKSLRPVLPSRNRRAFSLVEVLVVLGILAVLAALIYPAIGRAMDASHGPKCLDNLRKIMLAMRHYAFDHGNVLPVANSDDVPRWTRRLGEVADYLPPPRTNAAGTKIESIAFVCPAARYNGKKGDTLVRTYVCTAALYGPDSSNRMVRTHPRPLASIDNPSSVPLVFEGKAGSATAVNSHIDRTFAHVTPDIQAADAAKTTILDYRHGGKMHVGMADGTIRVFTPQDFLGMNAATWEGRDP